MDKLIPIGKRLQDEVIQSVADYIARAETIFARQFKPIEICFDLSGRSAGMYKVFHGKRVIRFNPYHFAKHPEENMLETIPHEVAHYITDQIYGIKNIRPHGKEWQAVMNKFGVEPKRTFSYSLEGIPTRQHKKFNYKCSCTEFKITTRRHHKILRGQAVYSCRHCGENIKQII